MFDIGASELLVIAIVAILVIGPKDMPLALRTAGRWIGKMRRISAHFRSGIDAMVREAEMEEMDRKWREQNEAIMARYPADQMTPLEAPGSAESAAAPPPAEPPRSEEPAAGTGETDLDRSTADGPPEKPARDA